MELIDLLQELMPEQPEARLYRCHDMRTDFITLILEVPGMDDICTKITGMEIIENPATPKDKVRQLVSRYRLLSAVGEA